MSLDKNGRICSSDQTVDRKKYDECPLWENLKRKKDDRLEKRANEKA